jgi:hypothetical protein
MPVGSTAMQFDADGSRPNRELDKMRSKFEDVAAEVRRLSREA